MKSRNEILTNISNCDIIPQYRREEVLENQNKTNISPKGQVFYSWIFSTFPWLTNLFVASTEYAYFKAYAIIIFT